MNRIEHKSLSFSQLKKKFDEQVFAIPELQRNYVWDAARVCGLLDSIYNHYPIGVGMIWKAQGSKSVEIRPNNKTIIPAYNVNNKYIEFIIDGQQRLSSLFGIMFGISPDKEKTKTDFTKVFFRLAKDGKSRFVYSPKLTENSKGYIRVADILTYPVSILSRRYRLNNGEASEVRKCATNFKGYRFHFLTVNSNNLEEVRETFIRINSQGMTVRNADTLFAKTTKVGLRDLVETTRKSLLFTGLNNVDPKAFIYMLALSEDETTIGKAALESFHKKFEKKHLGKKEFAKAWKKYRNAFTNASDYLQQEFGITQYNLLPSDNIFTMLSYFFYLHPKRPVPSQKREIKKWFWHTVFGERYSGRGFGKNIPTDIQFFRKLASGRSTTYTISFKINCWDLLRNDYRKSGASSIKGFFLFLRSKKPRYLENGELMLLDHPSNIANRKDKHHVFPRDLLSRKGVNDRLKHAIVNICLLAANENQVISNAPPYKYLLPYRKKIFFSKTMKSHLIPCSPAEGVWQANIKSAFLTFINKRGYQIVAEIERTAGVGSGQMFEKFDSLNRL